MSNKFRHKQDKDNTAGLDALVAIVAVMLLFTGLIHVVVPQLMPTP